MGRLMSWDGGCACECIPPVSWSVRLDGMAAWSLLVTTWTGYVGCLRELGHGAPFRSVQGESNDRRASVNNSDE